MSHVVVTKPSVTQIILPLVKRMHPGRRILYLSLLQIAERRREAEEG